MRRCAATGIRPRLLAFNALLVFLPAAGVLFLDTYEQKLLADQERAMVAQARVLAAGLSGRGDLDRDDLNLTLEQLDRRSGARIRVVDPTFRVLVDSSLLGPRREGPPELDVSGGPRDRLLYRIGALPFRVYRRFLARPEPSHSSADAYAGGGPVDGAEIRAALAGRYGAATRISSGGQRSVTLYSAIPVRDGPTVVGTVLVSQSTFRILQALYQLRVDVFRVFLLSLAGAAVLSLLVSRTIARPLEALRAQAEALLDGRGRLRGHFEPPSRRDEIGDLGRSLAELSTRLHAHLRGVEAVASDVSHELKNPLASLRAATELLADAENLPDRERFRRLVEREIARMEQLIDGVREIGRLDAWGRDDEETLRLDGLLEGAVEAQRVRGGPPIALSTGGPLQVRGSATGLGRVFENLLDNAASFSPAGGTIEVCAKREHGEVRVTVLDRGRGIPDEHRERVFDRFFSYRPEEPDPACRHTGLGLALAKALVESHGGAITAASRPGGGAMLEVRLPIAEPAGGRQRKLASTSALPVLS